MKKRHIRRYLTSVFSVGLMLIVMAQGILAFDTISDANIFSVAMFTHDDGGNDVQELNVYYYTSTGEGARLLAPDSDELGCYILRRRPSLGCLIHFCEDDDDDDDMAFQSAGTGDIIEGRIHKSLSEIVSIVYTQGCPDRFEDETPAGGPGGCDGEVSGNDEAIANLEGDRFRTGTNDIICRDNFWQECNAGKVGEIVWTLDGIRLCVFDDDAPAPGGTTADYHRWVLTTDADYDGFSPDERLPVDIRDCDDGELDTHPGTDDLEDNIDNNCDGTIDEDAGEADNDGDGQIDEAFGGVDCNDEDPDIRRFVDEVCDGIDNDCDDQIDDNCEGDASESSCEETGNVWVEAEGGACCGDDGSEFWSIFSAGDMGTNACFATRAISSQGIAGMDLFLWTALENIFGGGDELWTGDIDGNGISQRMIMHGNEVTSAFIEIPRGFLYTDFVFMMDVNMSGVGENRLDLTIEEGKESGSAFSPFDYPFVTGSVEGDTDGQFIVLRYRNSSPQVRNEDEAEEALADSDRIGFRIKLEKSPGSLVVIKRISLFAGIPAQILHYQGEFYSCGNVLKFSSNRNTALRIANLQYTNPENGVATGDQLIPEENMEDICAVKGSFFCDTDSRWRSHPASTPYDQLKYFPVPLSAAEGKEKAPKEPKGGSATSTFRGAVGMAGDITGDGEESSEQQFAIYLDEGVEGSISVDQGAQYALDEGLTFEDTIRAGDIGYRFIGGSFAIERLDQVEPREAGCCPDTYCWNGYSCVAGSVSLNGTESPDFTYGGISYNCVNGEWRRRVAKKDQLEFKTGYCSADMCYFNDGDIQITTDDRCVSDRFYDGDYYCERGNWTTRTSLLAAQLLNLTINNYELFCGDLDTVLNDVDYTETAGEVRSFFSRLTGGGYTCNDEREEDCLANNACVMHYTVSDEDRVVFGTSLNILPSATGDDRDDSFLRLFPESLNTETTGHQDYCDSVLALPTPENKFYGCNRNSPPIEGSEATIWYNPKMNMLIYSKQPITIQERELRQLFKDIIRNPFSSIINDLPAALGLVSYAGEAEADFLEDAAKYNTLYMSRKGSKRVQGFKEDLGRGSAGDKFFTVKYQNIGVNVCNRMTDLTRLSLSGCVAGITCICENITSSGSQQQLSVKASEAFFLWPDFTAKIRLS